jgi:hypothetical protein
MNENKPLLWIIAITIILGFAFEVFRFYWEAKDRNEAQKAIDDQNRKIDLNNAAMLEILRQNETAAASNLASTQQQQPPVQNSTNGKVY